MARLALVTDVESLPIDFDMDLLINACRACGLDSEIADWTDPGVHWQSYDMVLLRSPRTYADRLQEFRDWCSRVDAVTRLHNPFSVINWGLDKRYLADLLGHGVPIVPTAYLHPGDAPAEQLRAVLAAHPDCRELVVKPTVGAYSRNVGRYTRDHIDDADGALAHVDRLFADGVGVIVQPYLASIDEEGETDMIYFDGHYSHAIRKAPLLMPDGTVNVPTTDTRSPRVASEAERRVAAEALEAVTRIFDLSEPLLYARIDLIRDRSGSPVVLELEISEPSLSLPFAGDSPDRFARAIAARLERNATGASFHQVDTG